MGKNIVVCLDGTSNQLRAAVNTNVVRLFDALDLSDPAKQVAYYDRRRHVQLPGSVVPAGAGTVPLCGADVRRGLAAQRR